MRRVDGIAALSARLERGVSSRAPLAPHLPAAGGGLPHHRSSHPDTKGGSTASWRRQPGAQDRARSVWTPSATRCIGLGDLGLRAYTGLRRVCRQQLARERFDALFITIYPTYPALLGPGLKSEFGVPFILDYQDPWVGAWGQSVGGGASGSPDLKSRASRALSTWLEPRAVVGADALVAVSQGTLDGVTARLPFAARLPQAVVPLGFEPDDFAAVMRRPGASPFDPSDGLVHLCYVGTLLPTGLGTLRLLLRALDRARREDPAAAPLRLHFFGTSNQSESSSFRVLPVARECGVEDVVTEVPGRLDYLDALHVLTQASAILLHESLPAWKLAAAALVLTGLAVNMLWPKLRMRFLAPA